MPIATKQEIIDGLKNVDSKSTFSNLLQTREQLTYLMNNLGAKSTIELLAKLNLMPAEQLIGMLETAKTHMQRLAQSSAYIENHELQTEDASKQQTLKTNAIIEKALENPQAKEAILKLAEDFNKIKELFSFGIKHEENNKWQNFFLPIYDGERITQNKVSVHRKPNQYIRFIVGLSFEAIGDIQLDGLIKLKPDTNIPENFDLTVRFKEKLNQAFQAEIFEIYKISQDISGIKGGLEFENVDEFLSEPADLA